jgi:transposase
MCSAWVIQRVCGGTWLRWYGGGWRRRDYCERGSASPRWLGGWEYTGSRSAGGLGSLASPGCGLRKAGRTGRPPKLSPAQLRDLERALKRGPEACRFASRLWTASRVRDLIEYRTGVRYHEDHVWRILRKLNWTCQRPSGRAKRDEEAIRQRKKVAWPRIKKSPLERRTIVFIDESGLSERPHRVRTWAPRGQTPGAATSFQLTRCCPRRLGSPGGNSTSGSIRAPSIPPR